MKKSFLLANFLLAISVPAFAYPAGSELPQFDLFDTPITVPSFSERVIYKFNPPANGVLTAYEKADDAYVFVGKTYYKDTYTVLAGWYGTGPVSPLPEGYDYGFAYPMTPDQEYYVSIPLESFTNASEVLFTWEQEETTEVSVTAILPEPNLSIPFNYNSYHDILVFADKSISSFTSVTLKYHDKEFELPKGEYCGINGSSANQFLQIIVAREYKNYIAQAANEGADQVTITVKGLSSEGLPVTGNSTGNPYINVEDGTVTFVYAVTEAPTYLPVESSWPSMFYNYWEPGDPEGMATLVFDQPLSSVDKAWVNMGHLQPGEGGGENTYQSYEITPLIDGNKIILDFTGAERKGNVKEVTVLVQNVIGESGLPADLGEMGTVLFQYIPYTNEAAPSDDTSLVRKIEVKENSEEEIYDLSGNRIDSGNLGNGIYIINGKKILHKQ